MTHSTDSENSTPLRSPADEGFYPPLPREQDAPRPLILVLIVSLVLIVGVAYYVVNQSGLADSVIGEPMRFGMDEPVMDLDELVQEREKRNLLGRDVALWRVPVERVVGDYTFWVGSDEERRVPVVLLAEQASRQEEHQSEVNRGDTLAVFGTVRAIREVRLLDEVWAMEAEEWASVLQATIYISAIRVEHLSRAGQ